MALEALHYAVCPWCEKRTDSSVDHLFAAKFTRTTWYCNHCRNAYDLEVSGPLDVKITRSEQRGHEWSRTMTLLKLNGKDGPVFFVMDHDAYVEDGEKSAEIQASLQYFFEEHSCPTNWLNKCVAVIEDGDADPHGFLEFVRAVEVAREFDEDSADWFEMFPETRPEPDFQSPIADSNRMRAFNSQPCPTHGATCRKVGGGLGIGLDVSASVLFACGTELAWQTGDDEKGHIVKRA